MWISFSPTLWVVKLSFYLPRVRKNPEGQGSSELMELILVLIFFQFGPGHFLLFRRVFYPYRKLFFTFYPGSLVSSIKRWSGLIWIAHSAIAIGQKFFSQMINHLVNNICWKMHPFHTGFKCHIYVLLNKYTGLFLALFSVTLVSHYSHWRSWQEVFWSQSPSLALFN